MNCHRVEITPGFLHIAHSNAVSNCRLAISVLTSAAKFHDAHRGPFRKRRSHTAAVALHSSAALIVRYRAGPLNCSLTFIYQPREVRFKSYSACNS